MASIKAALMTILNTDAQINNAANLGGMLGSKYATSPYGIYYHHPPAKPVAPFITYHIGFATGEQPRQTEVKFTTWADDLATIANRIHVLLDRQQLGGLTDYRFLQLIWDWHSEEIWDEDIESYARVDRFLVKSWKT